MIMIMRINPIFKICEIHKMNHDTTVKGTENIINNKESGHRLIMSSKVSVKPRTTDR